MITLSAICPAVISVTSGMASVIEANVCVAPNSIAFSRLNSSGSTATTRAAPAIRAPCTALMPMPPMPTTTTVSPTWTSARFVAEPQPVATPQRHERHAVEREVVVDLDHRHLRHARQLGERAELGQQRHRLTVDVVAVGAVGDHPAAERPGAGVAQVAAAGEAVAAVPARRHEAGRHVVADLHGPHPGPDGLDHAGALVAADDREEAVEAHHREHLRRRDHVAGDEVLVAVAQAGGLPAHEDLTLLRIVDVDLLDLPVLLGSPQDGGVGLRAHLTAPGRWSG